ncbi:MAG: cell division protein FtsL [Parasulfuritortus sp.]|jgi:cell division protein FtsL|nr:cell division protein FtsL [Parasulfuritortus sp.]
MSRINPILAVILVLCALAVVTARYQARELFMELQAGQKKSRDLDVEWGRLQLEQSTWAMHSRIEQIARGQLHMSVPDTKQIQVLKAPENKS